MDKKLVKVNKLVRDKQIRLLEKSKSNPKYTVLNGSKKTAKLNKLVKSAIDKYTVLSDKAKTVQDKDFDIKDCKERIRCLVEIEELIKSIGENNSIEWRDLWREAKLSVPIKPLNEYIDNYLKAYKARMSKSSYIEHLRYIESSLFEELKKYSLEYGKFYVNFQNRRVNLKKSKGGYAEGYYLYSFETNLQENKSIELEV